jgi:hypothetical protein
MGASSSNGNQMLALLASMRLPGGGSAPETSQVNRHCPAWVVRANSTCNAAFVAATWANTKATSLA